MLLSGRRQSNRNRDSSNRNPSHLSHNYLTLVLRLSEGLGRTALHVDALYQQPKPQVNLV